MPGFTGQRVVLLTSISGSIKYFIYKSILTLTSLKAQMNTGWILNKQINKLIEKEIRFVIIRGGGCGDGELDEGGQEVRTSSYKINKY